MSYENRQAPEGINISREHPLRQTARLLFASLVLMAVLVLALRVSGGWLASQVPFRVEQRLVRELELDFGDPAVAPELQVYLTALAAKVSAVMDLPDGIGVRVHYAPDATVNAFATIGGHLMFHRGLLERMPHENALAMVIAHEIAHVLHRDPITGVGGGLASMTALMLLTGNAGAAGSLLELAGGVTTLEFTRRAELAADAAALTAIGRTYGHVAGATAFFDDVLDRQSGRAPPRWQRFLQTHPPTADRIERLTRQAAREAWPIEGELTPLPDAFERWLDASDERDTR